MIQLRKKKKKKEKQKPPPPALGCQRIPTERCAVPAVVEGAPHLTSGRPQRVAGLLCHPKRRVSVVVLVWVFASRSQGG